MPGGEEKQNAAPGCTEKAQRARKFRKGNRQRGKTRKKKKLLLGSGGKEKIRNETSRKSVGGKEKNSPDYLKTPLEKKKKKENLKTMKNATPRTKYLRTIALWGKGGHAVREGWYAGPGFMGAYSKTSLGNCVPKGSRPQDKIKKKGTISRKER